MFVLFAVLIKAAVAGCENGTEWQHVHSMMEKGPPVIAPPMELQTAHLLALLTLKSSENAETETDDQGEMLKVLPSGATEDDNVSITVQSASLAIEQPSALLLSINITHSTQGDHNGSEETTLHSASKRSALMSREITNDSFPHGVIDIAIFDDDANNTVDGASKNGTTLGNVTTSLDKNQSERGPTQTATKKAVGLHSMRSPCCRVSRQFGTPPRSSSVVVIPERMYTKSPPKRNMTGIALPDRNLTSSWLASLRQRRKIPTWIRSRDFPISQPRVARSKKVPEHSVDLHEDPKLRARGCLPLKGSPQVEDRATCPFRFVTNFDQRRVPKMMETVQCMCEGSPCSSREGFKCVQVKRVVHMMRKVGRSMSEALELLPVACVCAYAGNATQGERPSRWT